MVYYICFIYVFHSLAPFRFRRLSISGVFTFPALFTCRRFGVGVRFSRRRRQRRRRTKDEILPGEFRRQRTNEVNAAAFRRHKRTLKALSAFRRHERTLKTRSAAFRRRERTLKTLSAVFRRHPRAKGKFLPAALRRQLRNSFPPLFQRRSKIRKKVRLLLLPLRLPALRKQTMIVVSAATQPESQSRKPAPK